MHLRMVRYWRYTLPYVPMGPQEPYLKRVQVPVTLEAAFGSAVLNF